MPRFGYLLPTRGIVLASDDRSTLAARTQAEVVGLARRVEAMGFDGVWVGDSVLAKPRLEPLTTLAAVATATDAIDLGTAVYLPALRNPVNVAHLTATVDQLSGGRLSLGVGVGIGSDIEAEYSNLGVSFDRRGSRTNELLEVVTALWTGDPVDYDGEFYRVEGASIGFSPVRRPPIYVPTAAFDPTDGFPPTIRERIVTHGDGWLPIAISPATYRDSLSTVRGYLEEAGRDPDSLEPAFYLDLVIDDDEAAAVEAARRFYDRYYPAWDALTEDEVRGHGVFGPPSQVAKTIEAYADAGVETLVVRLAARDQREQLRRFADVVGL